MNATQPLQGTPPLGRTYRLFVSVFIVLTLGAQIATFGVTLWRPGWLTARLYPILEYPMYAQAHYEGERVVGRWLLRGVLADGSEIDITEQSLRVSVWDFILMTGSVAAGAPNSPETLKAERNLVEIVKAREPRAHELVMLKLDSYPMKVTRYGAAAMPSETVLTIPMSMAASDEH